MNQPEEMFAFTNNNQKVILNIYLNFLRRYKNNCFYYSGLYALRNIQGENVQLRTNSGVLQSNNPRNPIVNNVGHYQHYSRPLCMQQSSATSGQRVSINVRCGPTSNEFNNQLITNETSTLSNAINQQQRTSIVSSGHSQPSKASSSMQTLTARVSHKNKSGNVSKPQRPSTSGVDLSMSNACVICFGAQKIYACIPCGHRCICNSCFKNSRYMITKCPLCRKTITQILKIYD